MSARPVVIWAVIVKNPRCEWIHTGTLARTRAAAKAEYLARWDDQTAALREFRKGRLRLARVVVSEMKK